MPAETDPVVILVDNKIRDLSVAALIAHQLERMGVQCRLEPLEAFRAVVGGYRPGMVVFNHLNASHLASWSRRLADLGVLVGVLPNEGFVYDEESRPFMAGRYHDVHVDHFFCWNQNHHDALIAEGQEKACNVHVVGVPRFDFYFEPWSRILPPAPPRTSGRPRVLLCTNFVLTWFTEESANRDMAYGDVSKKAATLRDYGGTVEAHRRGQRRLFDYLNVLVDDGRFEVVLRPHPNENRQAYQEWLDGLSAERRANILYDPAGSIASLILDCDLEISCESCTTAVESWIARKPTIALLFEKHPMLYRAKFAPLNVNCENPNELPDLIARQLAAPEQSDKRELRDRHLEEWAGGPDGNSARRIAEIMASAVRSKPKTDWSRLNANDYRRAAKLYLTRTLGLAYHFDPLLPLKHAVFGKRYAGKALTYQKSIKPRDVVVVRQRLNRFEAVRPDA